MAVVAARVESSPIADRCTARVGGNGRLRSAHYHEGMKFPSRLVG
jgi:hypothetical protein